MSTRLKKRWRIPEDRENGGHSGEDRQNSRDTGERAQSENERRCIFKVQSPGIPISSQWPHLLEPESFTSVDYGCSKRTNSTTY